MKAAQNEEAAQKAKEKLEKEQEKMEQEQARLCEAQARAAATSAPQATTVTKERVIIGGASSGWVDLLNTELGGNVGQFSIQR